MCHTFTVIGSIADSMLKLINYTRIVMRLNSTIITSCDSLIVIPTPFLFIVKAWKGSEKTSLDLHLNYNMDLSIWLWNFIFTMCETISDVIGNQPLAWRNKTVIFIHLIIIREKTMNTFIFTSPFFDTEILNSISLIISSAQLWRQQRQSIEPLEETYLIKLRQYNS